MHHLLEVWFGWVLHGGYWGIIALMAMESSIIPIPSEIVIPPAAFLAASGNLSMPGVILAGTIGSYLGAAIGYWICLFIGRPLIYRFGKYFLVTHDKLERAEVWLQRYETGGVFFARLLPVIRHLISYRLANVCEDPFALGRSLCGNTGGFVFHRSTSDQQKVCRIERQLLTVPNHSNIS